ncbi:MAG: SDR family oxidoreductase [Clostridium sp.]|nr:SDR family oxidoreductase [Clostridium sp.]
MNTLDKFKIKERVIIITGGAGFLGKKHAEAVLDGGGIPILIDISEERLIKVKEELLKVYPNSIIDVYKADIKDRNAMDSLAALIYEKYCHIDGLINNAANNPKVESDSKNMKNIRFEDFPIEMWLDDISVGLTGALICSQVFGNIMAKQNKGVILNISSDLGIIAPDQRIYQKSGLKEDEQMVKPVTYSVIKHGILGLTKYTATYWAKKGVRANSLCPAGVFNNQNEDFLAKLSNLIPMGRMADSDEYKGTILYLLSDASSYMTGATVIVDGGRTCW